MSSVMVWRPASQGTHGCKKKPVQAPLGNRASVSKSGASSGMIVLLGVFETADRRSALASGNCDFFSLRRQEYSNLFSVICPLGKSRMHWAVHVAAGYDRD